LKMSTSIRIKSAPSTAKEIIKAEIDFMKGPLKKSYCFRPDLAFILTEAPEGTIISDMAKSDRRISLGPVDILILTGAFVNVVVITLFIILYLSA